MITGKEYPATHSMDTAWFAIDSDGNVGILEFDENGPVPDGIPQTCSSEVLMETMPEKHDCVETLPWTNDQVEEILKRMSEFKSNTELDFSFIIQIDTAQTDYFRKLFSSTCSKDHDFCKLVCLSEQAGLYYGDFYYLNKQKKKLTQKGTIHKYMNCRCLHDTNNHYDERIGKVVFEQDFEHFPIYLFQQPYWTKFPMRKTYVPKYPLKESQLSNHVREKALRLPFRFDDKEEMQIAEYFPFDCTRTQNDSGEYYLLPTSKGKELYIRSNSLPFVRCGMTCNICGFECSDMDRRCFSSNQYCERPTLAIIYGVDSCMEHEWMEHWPILRHAASLPIIHGYPEVPDFNAGKHILKEGYDYVFKNCKVFLEESLQTIRPYALILFEETKNTLGRHYHIEGDKITIGGVEYPYFMYEKMAEVYDNIKSYAEMPYRGKIINRIKEI